MTSELHIKILNEMKRILLMRDNASFHISDKTTEFIKNIKMKESKDWPSYSPDLNQIENIYE